MRRNKQIKAGIIGCGAIGSRLAKEIIDNLSKNIKLVALCDADIKRAEKLAHRLKSGAKILSVDSLIRSCDLIIEAASAKVSFEIANKVASAGKEVLVMSVGGILGKDSLFDKAKKTGAKIYIPSGAIAGIDAIKAAKIAGIKKLSLTTYKGARSLEGAPFLVKKRIDVYKFKKETVIFSGTVKEAVKGFPANINVAAILSLASAVSNIKVNIVLKPGYKFNMHKIEVEGNFGKITTTTENLPCPDNKKTSYLAVLSAISVLRNLENAVKIGN